MLTQVSRSLHRLSLRQLSHSSSRLAASGSGDQSSSESAVAEEQPPPSTESQAPRSKKTLSDLSYQTFKVPHNVKPADDLSAHRRGSAAISDGLIGEHEWEWDEIKHSASQFPTAETARTLFNGVKYEDLPVAYLHATKNNTKVYFYTANHEYITSTTARREGFKNARKKTEVAGQTTGIAAGLRALRRDVKQVRVIVQGLGPGRFSAINGMAMAGVNVVSITDFSEIMETGKRVRSTRSV